MPSRLDRSHVFNEGDQPLADVRVSNRRDVVRTNAECEYELTVDSDDIIFVIKPKGYRTPLSEDNLPRFYYIHKPAGSPDLNFKGVEPTGELPSSIDFPLYEQIEVHPGLSWIEVQATAVEIDRCLEVFAVAVASDATLD